jgi:hypothetical protein
MLEDPDSNDVEEVGVVCGVEIEPTEIEGGYTFHDGGFKMANYEFQPFRWKGKSYSKSLRLPPELLRYVNYNLRPNENMKMERALEKNDTRTLYDFLEISLENTFEDEMSKYDVPVERYPRRG